MTTDQPTDEWDYLPTDDELEALGEGSSPDDLPAEELALHVEHPDRRRPTDDPGQAEVALGVPDGEAPVTYFDDEHPESGAPPRATPVEHEPDLEEILESQHYAFDTTVTDADES